MLPPFATSPCPSARADDRQRRSRHRASAPRGADHLGIANRRQVPRAPSMSAGRPMRFPTRRTRRFAGDADQTSSSPRRSASRSVRGIRARVPIAKASREHLALHRATRRRRDPGACRDPRPCCRDQRVTRYCATCDMRERLSCAAIPSPTRERLRARVARRRGDREVERRPLQRTGALIRTHFVQPRRVTARCRVAPRHQARVANAGHPASTPRSASSSSSPFSSKATECAAPARARRHRTSHLGALPSSDTNGTIQREGTSGRRAAQIGSRLRGCDGRVRADRVAFDSETRADARELVRRAAAEARRRLR